jgi:hypothetical protein
MDENADLRLARRWRSRAEEYRAFAGATTSPMAKEALRRMGLSYDALADGAEDRAAHAPSSEAAITGKP